MRHESLKHIIKIFLLVLFSFHYGNITMFYHIHERNGQIIAHSHLWIFGERTETQLPPHTHTDTELKTIQQINTLQTNDAIAAIQIAKPSDYLLSTFIVYTTLKTYSNNTQQHQLRGPPTI